WCIVRPMFGGFGLWGSDASSLLVELPSYLIAARIPLEYSLGLVRVGRALAAVWLLEWVCQAVVGLKPHSCRVRMRFWRVGLWSFLRPSQVDRQACSGFHRSRCLSASAMVLSPVVIALRVYDGTLRR